MISFAYVSSFVGFSTMISGYGLFLLGESLMMKRKKAYGECMAGKRRKGYFEGSENNC